MNGEKVVKLDSFLERLVRVALFVVLILAKVFRIPPTAFRGKLRRVAEHWTLPMLFLYVRSFGTRVYMDQPCRLRVVPTGLRCVVDTAYRLTDEQIAGFYADGYIGPLTALPRDEMLRLAPELAQGLATESRAFGFKTPRDRHLDLPLALDLFRRPEIVERLAQLLGPDLIIWRSQFFNQEPGAPPITWHQASTYMLEDYQRPILEPPTPDELFQLTTWIAIDDATVENGCLHFVRGTHDRIRAVRIGGEGGFYDAHFEMEFEPDPGRIVPMELRAGQFVIFAERCIHGSPGNNSERRRMGINFRTVTPATRVYNRQEVHFASHLRETYDLSAWGVYLLRGEDRFGHNKLFEGAPDPSPTL